MFVNLEPFSHSEGKSDTEMVSNLLEVLLLKVKIPHAKCNTEVCRKMPFPLKKVNVHFLLFCAPPNSLLAAIVYLNI